MRGPVRALSSGCCAAIVATPRLPGERPSLAPLSSPLCPPGGIHGPMLPLSRGPAAACAVLLTFALLLGLTLRVVFSATRVPLGLLSAAPALLNLVHIHGLLQSAPGPVFVQNSGPLLSRANVRLSPRYPARISPGHPVTHRSVCLGPAALAAPLASGTWRLFSRFSTLFRVPLHYVQLPESLP